MIYKKYTIPTGVEIIVAITDEGRNISFSQDPANTDYQEYLKWLEEGNLPSPADIVEPSPTASVTPLPAEE